MLEVHGDSMIDAAICDGDYVVIREQPSAVNGDIVAALLDDEATIKTFRKDNGHIWLIPHNPAYSPDRWHPTRRSWARSSACCVDSDRSQPSRTLQLNTLAARYDGWVG